MINGEIKKIRFGGFIDPLKLVPSKIISLKVYFMESSSFV